MGPAPISESRRTWSTLAAALPLALLSAQFIFVLFAPNAGLNRDWIGDAKVLVKLEFFLLLVAPLVVNMAQRLSESRRVVGLGAMAAVCGALVYGLWFFSGDATLVAAASALIAGRFATAVLGGPEIRFELLERWFAGLLLYFTLVAFVFLVEPHLLDRKYRFIPPGMHAVAFCAAHYFLLACIEAVGIAPKWREPEILRPMLYLRKPFPLGGNGVRLEFAGDAVELVSDERIRPTGRIFIGFVGGLFLMFPVVLLFIGGLRAFTAPPFWVLAFCGVMILRKSLSRGTDARHVQLRHGEIAIVEVSRHLVASLSTLESREIEGLEVMRIEKPPDWQIGTRKRGETWPTGIVTGLEDEVTAGSLKRLFELYLSGDPSPNGLRKALDADPALAALLGARLIERLLAAKPLPESDGSINCPACGSQIVASTPRCPYCGLLYPVLDR